MKAKMTTNKLFTVGKSDSRLYHIKSTYAFIL